MSVCSDKYAGFCTVLSTCCLCWGVELWVDLPAHPRGLDPLHQCASRALVGTAPTARCCAPSPLFPAVCLQKNHLSGLQRKLLKLSFWNQEQLQQVGHRLQVLLALLPRPPCPSAPVCCTPGSPTQAMPGRWRCVAPPPGPSGPGCLPLQNCERVVDTFDYEHTRRCGERSSPSSAGTSTGGTAPRHTSCWLSSSAPPRPRRARRGCRCGHRGPCALARWCR